MQLFNLLKQAQQNGPNESERAAAADQQSRVQRDNHAGSKDEEYIQHQDSKLEGDLAHVRIDEVEQEHEQTCNEDDREIDQESQRHGYHSPRRQAEEQAYDSDAFQQHNRHKQRRKSNFDESPGRNQRIRNSNENNVFRSSGRHDSTNLQQSMNKLTNRSLQSTHGMNCIINPEQVEPQSPDHLDESLNEISPRQLQGSRAIDIYIDKESPVAVSGYFPRSTEMVADRKSPNQTKSPASKQTKRHDQVNDYSPDVRAQMRQSNGSEVLSSPKLNSTRRNYFRKDQTNKALVQSMRRSGDSLTSLQQQAQDAERTRRNVSKHDQTLGGLHDQHGSQHEEASKLISTGEGEADISPTWHDVQVIQSDAGSQELVIENLENLGEATALIVTRDNGGNFKVGIQQGANKDNNYSEVISSAAGSTRDRFGSVQKLKLRGKLNAGSSQQHQIGILPPTLQSTKQLRTVSVNSRSSKASTCSRITMPQINAIQQPVVQNKYKTFQDPNESRDSNFNDPNLKFKTRNRESASDNKRLVHEQTYETQRREQKMQNLELRSQFQSAKAEEMLKQSRDLRHKQNLSMSRKQSPADTLSQQSRHDTIGYVKVLDPIREARPSKNPLDRSDSKLGPTMLSNRIKHPFESTQQPCHNTQIANSSIHSRDAVTLTAGGININSFMTPDHAAAKNNTISVRLQDQQPPHTGLDSGFNSFINGAIPGKLSMSMQQPKKDFQSLKKAMGGNGQALSGLHGIQPQYGTVHATPQPSHFRNLSVVEAHVSVDAMSHAAGGLASVDEAKSQASRVSRQSNTDMKGANLVKISPKQTRTKGSPREHSPVVQSVFMSLHDSKETSVRQLEPGDEEGNKEPGAPTSPAKSAKKGDDEVNASGDSVENELKPKMSPSRTDTAFYDGKAVNTESKSKLNSPGSDNQVLSDAPDKLVPQTSDQGLNYHTTNEDGGDAYFPQILKYTENAPQESILSRDNYSTSNQPSTMQKNIAGAQARTSGGGPSKVKKYFNKNASAKQLSPVRDTKMSGQTQGNNGPGDASKQPRNIMNQNVARLEKQNPSAMAASVLSHSVTGDDDKEEFNQRATSLEHVSEETLQNDKLKLNKDGSAYNIAPNDIAAIPKAQNSPKRSTMRSKAREIEEQQTLIRSQEVRNSLNESHKMKKQISKSSLRSSMRQGQLAKMSASQRSKASLASKKGKGTGQRPSSMLPVLGRQSDTEKPMAAALRSSGRALPKKIHNQQDLPGSATKFRPYEHEMGPGASMMTVGTARAVVNQAPEGAMLPMKLPSVASPTVGTHLAQPTSRAAVLSSEKTKFFGQAGSDAANLSQLNKTMQSTGRPQPVPKVPQDNTSMLSNMANQMQGPAAPADGDKPIMRYMESSDAEQKSYPLKYFKGQDLELYYMEKQLKPGVEREIKEGFFEIRKKFGEGEAAQEQVQVYVSHLCLHNYHPIFCKFNLDVVKTILNFSQIIYLKKGQTLYQQGFNDRYLYVILFGKLRLSQADNDAPIGQPLNIGWTVGEEILFKSDRKTNGGQRTERCRSLCESCVLGIEKRSLAQIKRTLVERGQAEEFVKLEVVLRGNYLVKKAWRN